MKYVIYSFIVAAMLLLTGCADAGDDQQVNSGDTVTLDGSGSTPDAGGQIVSYQWKQLKTPNSATITLANSSTATPTFSAPDVDALSEFIFKLKTVEHYACKPTSNNQQKCRNNTTYDLVSIFVEPSDDTVTGFSISGTITDFNNVSIPNATVSIGDKTVTTDANGLYRVDAITAAERISVNVSHPDYLANSRIVTVDSSDVLLDMKLGSPKASHTFLASTGAVVSHDGAMVELPAEGYVDSNGAAYSGDVTVKMSYYPITTRSGRAAFPGTFEGKDGNDTFAIQSFGFMNVELSGSQGEALNLAPGATATLTFPIDYTLSAPSTIPLWYYDTDEGYWIQEGEAVKNGYTNYTGTVSHFTAWNLDAKGPVAKLKGCVQDSNGTRIPNAQVQFSATNWDSRIVPTDANGSIEVINILAETPLTFSASKKIGSQWFYGEYPTPITLSEGENKTLSECVTLQETSLPNGSITVTGTVMLENWFEGTITPATSGIIRIYSAERSFSEEGYMVLAEVEVSSDGSFSATFQTTDALYYNVEFQSTAPTGDYGAWYYGYTTFRLFESKTIYDIGDFIVQTELG